MLKYFKWELLSELRKLRGILITLCITFLAVLVSDVRNGTAGIFIALFAIEMYILMFAALYYGGKRTIDTYSKKTFLLESMIPISAKKLLLVKYVISILLSLSCCIALFIGFAIVGEKININVIDFMRQLLGDFDFQVLLFKGFVIFTSLSVFVTSLMTASFVFLKSMFPSMKKVKGLSYLLTYFIAYFFFQILSPVINDGIYIASLVFLTASVVCYFITVVLVENKLEVYN